MFISSCYFIYNAWRDKAAEREFDILDDTGTRSSSEIQEKKWAKKSNFKQIYVNVTKQVNSYGRIIHLEFILT